MKILFIGDIVGKPGRRAVQRWLPQVREEHRPDVVIANAENSAGGLGATPDTLGELMGMGVDAFTMGNHTWRKKMIVEAFERLPNLVRPANYPPENPGRGSALIKLKDGRTLGLLNLQGRVFMDPHDCPFRTADTRIEELRAQTPVVLVDMHAEATSEKVAMGWFLDGRCSAVVGTHTHVPTNDCWVMPQGTAFQCDVGMCGPLHSVIGVIPERVVDKFLTGIPKPFEVARGPEIFCACVIDVDDASGNANQIEGIVLRQSGN